MCIRRVERQGARMPSICKGDRSQPRYNQCNSAHEASAVQKRNLEVDRQNSSHEPIQAEAGRMKLTILHSA
jgi:hypothetical protein